MTMPNRDPFLPFERWLEHLDSHNGRLLRRSQGGHETEYDLVCLIPSFPGQTIFTIGDLRALVEAGKRLRRNDHAAAGRKGPG